MGFVKQTGRKSPRKSPMYAASLLGLTAGAVGWSGVTQAASEETNWQMMLLPEHYELMENGVVVFKLETGENLSLTADQYIILEDGLLLITDELAQASIYSLPVMGSIRAQLLSELAPQTVTHTDSTVALATDTQTRSILDGEAQRLFTNVSDERYELAQNIDNEEEDDGLLLLSGEAAASALGIMILLSYLDPQDLNRDPVILESINFPTLFADGFEPEGEIGDSLGLLIESFLGSIYSEGDGEFVNENGESLAEVYPPEAFYLVLILSIFLGQFSVAEDPDNDPLSWELISVSSSSYEGYSEELDSDAELTQAHEIFYHPYLGSVVLPDFVFLEGVLIEPSDDLFTWTYKIAVHDGRGGSDTISVDLDWADVTALEEEGDVLFFPFSAEVESRYTGDLSEIFKDIDGFSDLLI